MQLRPYQETLVSEARSAFRAGHRRILLQLPTGGGKTVVLSEIARTASLQNSRVLVMAHRIEIVHQIIEKLITFGLSPDLIASGSPPSSSPTLTSVAMQQTLVRRLGKVEPPAILIVDEAHHQAAPGYLKIVEAFPNAAVIGLTATPARLDGKPLKEYFDTMVLGPTVRELIDMDALSDFVYLAPEVDPQLMEDLKSIRKTAGDYNKGQLESAVNKKRIIGDVVNHYRDLFNGKPVIAFCVSVAHGEAVASEFTAAGFRASAVSGAMKKPERDHIIEMFRSGRLSVLVSCDLIGEGFDVPDCAGVLLLRPTASLIIFLQQVGRALRPKADGSKAIILDHVGNCYRHGRPDDVRAWSLEGKLPKNKVKIKQCPKCYAIIHPAEMDLSLGCPSGIYPDDCAYLGVEPESTGEKKITIEHVDGKLVEFIPAIEVGWCSGIDVKTAEGKDWQRILRAASDDVDKLKQIAKIRGFKPGWVYMRVEKVNAMRQKYGNA